MKTKKFFYTVASLLMVSLLFNACGNSGDEFLGTWQQNDGSQIVITAAGETAYTVKKLERSLYNTSVVFSNTTTATYQDGNLVSRQGVVCSYSNDKLISEGKEYQKVN